MADNGEEVLKDIYMICMSNVFQNFYNGSYSAVIQRLLILIISKNKPVVI